MLVGRCTVSVSSQTRYDLFLIVPTSERNVQTNKLSEVYTDYVVRNNTDVIDVSINFQTIKLI